MNTLALSDEILLTIDKPVPLYRKRAEHGKEESEGC